MNFQVVGGSFKEHSPFVVLNDHFIDGNSADDIIADELNKNYIGWILVVNENDPTINSLGGFMFNYEDTGESKKYFVGNKKYYQELLNNDFLNKNKIVKKFLQFFVNRLK